VSSMNVTVSTAVRGKRKRGLLPLLIVLFLISYTLLTTLVVRQDRAIDAQRTLIHLLFKDSLHLTALKAELRKHQAITVQAAANSIHSQTPSSQTQSSQLPLIQVPSAQAPSNTTKAQASTKTGRKSRKAQKQAPTRPPAELTDPSDMRRVTFSI